MDTSKKKVARHVGRGMREAPGQTRESEIYALQQIIAALKPLSDESRVRVIRTATEFYSPVVCD